MINHADALCCRSADEWYTIQDNMQREDNMQGEYPPRVLLAPRPAGLRLVPTDTALARTAAG